MQPSRNAQTLGRHWGRLCRMARKKRLDRERAAIRTEEPVRVKVGPFRCASTAQGPLLQVYCYGVDHQGCPWSSLSMRMEDMDGPAKILVRRHESSHGAHARVNSVRQPGDQRQAGSRRKICALHPRCRKAKLLEHQCDDKVRQRHSAHTYLGTLQ